MKKKFHCGIKVKQYRLLRGFSQADLGEKVGKTQAMISFIEKKGVVNKSLLNEIAHALDVSIEQLEYEDDDKIIDKFNKSLNKEAYYRHLQEEIEYLRITIEDLKKIIFKLTTK